MGVKPGFPYWMKETEKERGFEKRVLREIFGRMMEDLTDECRKLHN